MSDAKYGALSRRISKVLKTEDWVIVSEASQVTIDDEYLDAIEAAGPVEE